MIFTREQINALLRGETVQRRVVVKDGEYTWMCGMSGVTDTGGHMTPAYSSIHDEDGRTRFERDKTYAVQLATNKPCVWWKLNAFDEPIWNEQHELWDNYGWHPLRARITAIRREGSEWVLTLERAETK